MHEGKILDSVVYTVLWSTVILNISEHKGQFIEQTLGH